MTSTNRTLLDISPSLSRGRAAPESPEDLLGLDGVDAAFASRVLTALAATILEGERVRGKAVLEILCRELPASQASIMMRDGEQLVVTACVGHDDPILGRRVERGQGIAWRVMDAGKDLQLFGVFESGRPAYEEHRCSMVLPLCLGSATVGTLNVNRRDRGFWPRDVERARFAANAVARANHLSTILYEEVHPWRSLVDVLLQERPAWSGARQPEGPVLSIATEIARDLHAAFLGPQVAQAIAAREVGWSMMPHDPRIDDSTDLEPIVLALSAELLPRLQMDTDVADAIRFSAERWDGRGPFGLRGPELPLPSRILVAARAAACEPDRPYHEVLLEIAAGDPGRLCPSLVRAVAEAHAGRTSQRD